MEDKRLRNEANALIGEFAEKENAVNGYRDDFANKLLSGMGDDMMSELINPSTVDPKLEKKLKKRKRLSEIKDNLKRMFLKGW